MKITDIIRGILDLTDLAIAAQEQTAQEPVAVISVDSEQHEVPNELAIIQQLAGMISTEEPTYQNEPQEVTAPIGASFPGGNDMHGRKNPSDIRTNAPSMYPNYQAK